MRGFRAQEVRSKPFYYENSHYYTKFNYRKWKVCANLFTNVLFSSVLILNIPADRSELNSYQELK